MDNRALFYCFPDTLLRLASRENPDVLSDLFFRLGCYAGALLLVSFSLLRGLIRLRAGWESYIRLGTAFAVFCAALGIAVPFIPAGNPAFSTPPAGPNSAFLAGSLVQFAGLLGFEVCLTLSALRRRFLRWGYRQLLPLPLLALAAMLLPLSGQLRAPLSFACFSFALAGLHLTLLVLERRQKKPCGFFAAGAAVCAVLGSAFVLPPGQGFLFWPAALLAYLFLEYRLYPEAPVTRLLLLPGRGFSDAADTGAGGENPQASAARANQAPEHSAGAAGPHDGAEAEAEDAEMLEEDSPAPSAEQAEAALSGVPEGAPPEELPVHSPSVSSFIPKQFLAILNKKSVADLKLGDHIKQEMTIFFSDIRQFTALSENLTPEENFAFINSYLSRIVPEITKNGGFVDSYIGDAVLALFPQERGPDRAVRAAVSIQEKILIYNSHRAKCGYRPLSMGIGLHTGALMMGVVGTEDRMQSTVISDSVNLASRVESLTKAFRVSLAISEETFKKLEDPGSYKYRFVGKVRVKGKNEPVSIFEIFDGLDENVQKRKIQANRFFEQGMFHYYKKNYRDALQEFRHVLEILPEDGASAFYIDNCLSKIQIGGGKQ
ncbi:MAG: adenylate/guanylate cyclase domain-containing protein [Treponema sp.]|nr:adenylate/guanylate cyclase domain-containing protein [Treponema sp.]